MHVLYFMQRIIRDADKLDNCRVKLEDRLETFMDTSAEETGASAISPKVRDSILRHECILSSDRVTPMDYWISYLAYFYDITSGKSGYHRRAKLYSQNHCQDPLYQSGDKRSDENAWKKN